MGGAQGGLLMILASVVLFVLWTRGYLATWVGSITDALAGATTAKPITNPLTTYKPTPVDSRHTATPV
jgi:hypothetical protein